MIIRLKLSSFNAHLKTRGSIGGGENLLCHNFFAESEVFMEALVLVTCGIVIVVLIVSMVLFPVFLKVFLKEIQKQVMEVKEAVETIAESKRLSTVLLVKGKEDIEITSKDLQPKGEELQKNMLDAFESSIETYKNKKGRVTQPDTVAFVILNHSGLDQFVDFDVKKKISNALSRLIANQDFSGVKRFISTVAKNL